MVVVVHGEPDLNGREVAFAEKDTECLNRNEGVSDCRYQ